MSATVFNVMFPFKKPARLAIDVNRHLHLGFPEDRPEIHLVG